MGSETLEDVFRHRFGAIPAAGAASAGTLRIAGRGSCRAFADERPSLDQVRILCAAALAAPSKSDLQQRDILIVEAADTEAGLKSLLAAQEWIAGAPRLLLFLANNRRQRLIQQMHCQPFPNDHLDAFFNASLDAGIAMAFFMAAAEAEGLGCCPISTVRNHLEAVTALCGLPDHVFPVAGLAVGVPRHPTPRISPRLGLEATVHVDRFRDTSPDDIESYDRRRTAAPVTPPGAPAWSEAKARMYAEPQRTDFAAFARKIGFNLD